MLSAALVDVIRRATPYIHSIEPDEDGDCPVNGIAYELAPWHGYIDVSLRDMSDEVPGYRDQSDSPGWKYSGVLDEIGESEATSLARELIRETYDTAEESDGARIAHLLFIAAAQSLLDPQIVELLSSAGIDA